MQISYLLRPEWEGDRHWFSGHVTKPAKDMGALTVAVTTIPFHGEGSIGWRTQNGGWNA